LLIQSCNSNKKTHIAEDAQIIDTIAISSKPDFIDKLLSKAQRPKFVVLKEDENTMYAEISRIVDAYGKYFIVDSYGSRSVVSFDHGGKPVASYGQHGSGPGEFVFPWGVDVSENYVYILDASQKRLLKYLHNGEHVATLTIPFAANAFMLLNDKKILFNLEPLSGSAFQLCITDSLLNTIAQLIPYEEGYAGGWVTNDTFRKDNAGINYYLSPSDTIYRLDFDGRLIGKRLIEFEKGPIPQEAKMNYITAIDNGTITTGMQLLNNPITLSSGLCISEVDDFSSNQRLTVAINPTTNESGAKEYGKDASVFGINNPIALSDNGKLIGILNNETAELCKDASSLPDSLRNALAEGFRILVIQDIK